MSITVESIEDRSVVVGILGLGYVGLPLASAFLDAGFRVLGFDTDHSKIDSLEKGENYLKHLGQDMTRKMRDSDRFEATSDFDRLGEPDAVLLCVPTPLGEHREPDLSYVEQSTEMAAKTLRKGQLVVLESTTYPGTTRDLHGRHPRARRDEGRRGLPPRVQPRARGPGPRGRHHQQRSRSWSAAPASARATWPTDCTPRPSPQVHRSSRREVAEAAKLLENIYRAVNIALVNELKIVYDAMGIDVWEVIDAAATKPFGFLKFTPGPGLGGHCIPIDPFYLTWNAQRDRPPHAVHRARRARSTPTCRATSSSARCWRSTTSASRCAARRSLVLGLAYKPDVDDIRESPAIPLIEQLRELGADVRYHDPHVPHGHKMREHDLSAEASVDLDAETLAALDAVIVATDHKAFDWDLIARHAPLVVDTRNALASRLQGQPHYFKA